MLPAGFLTDPSVFSAGRVLGVDMGTIPAAELNRRIPNDREEAVVVINEIGDSALDTTTA